MNRTNRAILSALLAVSLLVTVPFALADHDGDQIPDEAENAACSRDLVANAIEIAGVGSCEGDDLTVEGDPSGAIADEDGDMVPDGQEPTVCGVEDPSSEQDGTCDEAGENYTAPSGVPVPSEQTVHETLCSAEDPSSETDGNCTANPDGSHTYNPPTPEGVPDPDDILPEDVPDPDDVIPEDVPDPEDLIPEDVPNPVPGGLPVVCRDPTANPVDFTFGALSDIDCDGYSNDHEVNRGCNPLDGASNPAIPGTCNLTSPPDPDDLPTQSPNACLDDPANPTVNPSDLDCDGRANDREINDGTNPLVTEGRAPPLPPLPEVPQVPEVPDLPA